MAAASFRGVIDIEVDAIRQFSNQVTTLVSKRDELAALDFIYNCKNLRRKLQRSVALIESTLTQWREDNRSRTDPQERLACEGELRAYSNLKDGYLDALGKGRRAVDEIEDILEELEPAGEANHTATTRRLTTAHEQTLDVQLPKWKLPVFDGKPQNWNTFWQSFEPAVHDKVLPAIQKMHYLVSNLQGEALQAVKGYSVTNENYDIVVNLLRKRFGDKRLQAANLQSELLLLPPAQSSLSSLRRFSESIERICQQLKELGKANDNDSMSTTIRSKLPKEIRTELAKEEIKDGQVWTTTTLREKLQQLITIRERVEADDSQYDPASDSRQRSRPHGGPSRAEKSVEQSRAFAVTGEKRIWTCLFCDRKHKSHKCRDYAEPESRRKRLSELERCWTCLKPGHTSRQCPSDKQCYNCKGNHHSLVCKNPAATQDSAAAQQRTGNSKPQNRTQGKSRKPPHKTVVNLATQQTSEDTATQPDPASVPQTVVTAATVATPQVLLMAKEISLTTPEIGAKPVTALAFFDNGSQTSFITERLARQLMLPKLEETELDVFVFSGGPPVRLRSAKYALEINCVDGRKERVVFTATPQITNTIPVASWKSQDQMLSTQDIGPASISLSEEEPDLLIGAGDFARFHLSAKRVGKHMMLHHTRVGPILCGQAQSPSTDPTRVTSLMAVGETNRDQMPDPHQLSDYWSLETIGILDDPASNEEDMTVWEHFKKTVCQPDHYEVKLPWREEMVPFLRSNYGLAYHRLGASLKGIEHHPGRIQAINNRFKEQLEAKFIELAEHTRHEGKELFLPFHPVFTEKELGEVKMRLVKDGSAKTRLGPSLNECLMRGPVLLQDLSGLLMRLRLPRVAVLADLEKAFLNVQLAEEDREFAKFLWLKDITKPLSPDNVQVYRYRCLAFGLVCSPFLLSATVKHHLEQFNSPVAREITDNIYVDNILLSSDDPATAIVKCREAKDMFSSARMNLREFTSNSVECLEALPAADRHSHTAPRILGMRWHTIPDELSIEFPKQKPQDRACLTRRRVLQELASIFDPLGLITPCLVQAKSFFQKLWEVPRDWDARLTKEEADQWLQLSDQWRDATVTIPRQIKRGGHGSEIHQLHACVDASQTAYAAAIYLRTESTNGVDAHLVYSKNRLIPKRGMTIPRAELTSILIGVRALNFVRQQLRLPVESEFLWSDSQIALHWINTPATQPRYVANRLREIRQTSRCQFRHVDGEENPADVATRGCSPGELQSNRLWWNGPSWLGCPESSWPETLVIPRWEVAEADRTIANLATTQPLASAQPASDQLIDASRFRSWLILLNTILLVMRFLKLRLGQAGNRFGELMEVSKGDSTAQHYALAERQALRLAQLEHPPSPAEIAQWRLIRDQDGLLRQDTRLGKSTESKDMKFPVFVPRSPWLTLLVTHIHRTQLHAGTDATLTAFLQRFWVPHTRRRVKEALRECRHCQRLRAVPYALPDMPPLPADRVVKHRPFESIGIDYLGPTATRVKGDLRKAWVVLITCLCTRSVYLDAVPDMTARTLLHVFRRFMGRRGIPARVISDNGTQFRALSQTLKAFDQERETHERWLATIQDRELRTPLAQLGIAWKFIPQLSPWAGGVYERLVSLVKRAFKSTLGGLVVDWDELATFVVEIEGVLNQRPITFVSDEPGAPRPLRPVDFLHPQATLDLGGLIDDETTDFTCGRLSTAQSLAKWWTSTQGWVNRFWDRWRTEYLLVLRGRNSVKHRSPRSRIQDAPKIGEVVIIEDRTPMRSKWLLGQVVEHVSNARAAKVRLGSGNVLTRPVSHLYSLEAVPKRIEPITNVQANPPSTLEETAPAKSSHPVGNPESPPPRRNPIRACRLRAGTVLNVLSAIIALICLFPTVSSMATGDECPLCTPTCIPRGLRIDAPGSIDKLDVCCVGFPCFVVAFESGQEIPLQRKVLLNPYRCELDFWSPNSTHPYRAAIHCPAQRECDLLDCYWCWEAILNPECRPFFTAFWLGGSAVAALSILCCGLTCLRRYVGNTLCLCRCLFYPLRMCLNCLRSCLSSSDGDDNDPGNGFRFRRTRNDGPRAKFHAGSETLHLAVLAILVILTGTQAVTTFTAQDETCHRDSTGGLTCNISAVTQLQLLPNGHPTYLLMRDPTGKAIGSIRVSLDTLSLHCVPRSEGFTRSIQYHTVTSHRCPGAGSCTNNRCSSLAINSKIPELEEHYQYPGTMHCITSCRWFFCGGCASLHGSCLFYYNYAKPTSPAVYEILTCPNWDFRMEATLAVEANDRQVRYSMLLVPGYSTYAWNGSIEVSPFPGAYAPAPILSRHFLTDNSTIVVLDHFPREVICPSREAAAQFKDCMASPMGCNDCQRTALDRISCQCQNRDWSKLFSDDRQRLPLQLGFRTLRNQGRNIMFDSQTTAVMLSLKIAGLRLVRREDKTHCTVTPGQLTGYYNDPQGAELSYSCKSDFGTAAVVISCGRTGPVFTSTCTANGSYHVARLPLDRPRVKLTCQAECPGGTHNFTVYGQLAYAAPLPQQISYDSIYGEAELPEGGILPTLPGLDQLKILGDTLKGFLEIVPYLALAVIVSIGIAMVSFLAVKLGLIFSTYRRLCRLLIGLCLVTSLPLTQASNNSSFREEDWEAIWEWFVDLPCQLVHEHCLVAVATTIMGTLSFGIMCIMCTVLLFRLLRSRLAVVLVASLTPTVESTIFPGLDIIWITRQFNSNSNTLVLPRGEWSSPAYGIRGVYKGSDLALASAQFTPLPISGSHTECYHRCAPQLILNLPQRTLVQFMRFTEHVARSAGTTPQGFNRLYRDSPNLARIYLARALDGPYRFRTTHLRPPGRNFHIIPDGISAESARRLWFGNRSVRAHFQIRHGLDLAFPDLPCIEVGRGYRRDGSRHFDYFPPEVIEVIPLDREPAAPGTSPPGPAQPPSSTVQANGPESNIEDKPGSSHQMRASLPRELMGGLGPEFPYRPSTPAKEQSPLVSLAPSSVWTPPSMLSTSSAGTLIGAPIRASTPITRAVVPVNHNEPRREQAPPGRSTPVQRERSRSPLVSTELSVTSTFRLTLPRAGKVKCSVTGGKATFLIGACITLLSFVAPSEGLISELSVATQPLYSEGPWLNATTASAPSLMAEVPASTCCMRCLNVGNHLTRDCKAPIPFPKGKKRQARPKQKTNHGQQGSRARRQHAIRTKAQRVNNRFLEWVKRPDPPEEKIIPHSPRISHARSCFVCGEIEDERHICKGPPPDPIVTGVKCTMGPNWGNKGSGRRSKHLLAVNTPPNRNRPSNQSLSHPPLAYCPNSAPRLKMAAATAAEIDQAIAEEGLSLGSSPSSRSSSPNGSESGRSSGSGSSSGSSSSISTSDSEKIAAKKTKKTSGEAKLEKEKPAIGPPSAESSKTASKPPLQRPSNTVPPRMVLVKPPAPVSGPSTGPSVRPVGPGLNLAIRLPPKDPAGSAKNVSQRVSSSPASGRQPTTLANRGQDPDSSTPGTPKGASIGVQVTTSTPPTSMIEVKEFLRRPSTGTLDLIQVLAAISSCLRGKLCELAERESLRRLGNYISKRFGAAPSNPSRKRKHSEGKKDHGHKRRKRDQPKEKHHQREKKREHHEKEKKSAEGRHKNKH